MLMALDPFASVTNRVLTPFEQEIVGIGNTVKCVWSQAPGEYSTDPNLV